MPRSIHTNTHRKCPVNKLSVMEIVKMLRLPLVCNRSIREMKLRPWWQQLVGVGLARHEGEDYYFFSQSLRNDGIGGFVERLNT